LHDSDLIFQVRVRNHAKMVDCYLTTYYNHKSVFGNRKQVANEIIDHPQDYHIYEGLSTLTNISRYDLPDPDVYRDFFKLNPLYEFQQLSATCTYFRGNLFLTKQTGLHICKLFLNFRLSD